MVSLGGSAIERRKTLLEKVDQEKDVRGGVRPGSWDSIRILRHEKRRI